MENLLGTYFVYAFTSVFALLVYSAMILFTIFRQYVIEQGRRRVFSGSWLYLIVLFLMPVFAYVQSEVRTAQPGEFKEMYEKQEESFRQMGGEEAVEKLQKEREESIRGFRMMVPTSIALIICYFCVSRVPAGNYGGGISGFTHGLFGLMGAGIKTFSGKDETIVHTELGADGERYMTATGTRGKDENLGCAMGAFMCVLYIVFGILLCPILVCCKFLFNYVLPGFSSQHHAQQE